VEIRPTQTPPPSWKVRQVQDDQGTRILDVEPTDRLVKGEPVLLRSTPAHLAEDVPPGPETYQEVLYSPDDLPRAGQDHLQATRDRVAAAWPGSEVRTLVQQGPVENRLDLTIVGDGYQAQEKDRFFQDARRLTDYLFRENTFASYLPLFNIHAVFVPSKDSGLTDVERKDTALGLYRSPQGSRRGVMPGNTQAIDRALDLAPDTDFPILVANDDFYGGLGGRYAITTRSENSGTMVLRHELGHNFGDVGEEYDGGQVYRGANHSRTANVPWKPWVQDQPMPVGKARSLVGSYPWKNLEGGAITIPFEVPGSNPTRIVADVSSVGWETPQDVSVLLDGQEHPVQGVYTEDRSFFRLGPDLTLEPGKHVLEIRERVADGDNVLASVRINALEADYETSPGAVGAFPSFAAGGRLAGYRPTHESCLMRDMRSKDFCAVDKENMWHRFLDRVSLIDDLKTEGRQGQRRVHLQTPALEGLDIRWFAVAQDGSEQEIPELAGQKDWPADARTEGCYRAQVTFSTPEVRTPTERFQASRTLSL